MEIQLHSLDLTYPPIQLCHDKVALVVPAHRCCYTTLWYHNSPKQKALRPQTRSREQAKLDTRQPVVSERLWAQSSCEQRTATTIECHVWHMDGAKSLLLLILKGNVTSHRQWHKQPRHTCADAHFAEGLPKSQALRGSSTPAQELSPAFPLQSATCLGC